MHLRTAANVEVQFFDRHRRIAQGGDLANHVHALVELLGGGNVHHRALGIAIDAFGGDAQTAEVEVFQLVANFFGTAAVTDQPATGVEELAGKLRIDTARGVAGAGFQIHGAAAAQGFVLEALNDGAAVDDFAGEQVGGAHQHAHLHAARGQRRSHGGDHGAGQGVVNAAGKQDVHVLRIGGRDLGQQQFDHLLPKREAGDGPDMPAAFAAFEHKAPRALFQIHAQQCWRRRMDVSGDAALFEFGGLVGATPGDQGKRRGALPDLGALFFAQRVRHEAQQAHAPGRIADPVTGLFEHVAHLRAAHERQRQQGQGAALGHVDRKTGHVRHPRHWPLHHREAGAVRAGQRAALVEEALARGRFDLLLAGAAQGLQQFCDGAVTLAIARRETNGLADRQQVFGVAGPGHSRLHALAPFGDGKLVAFGGAVIGVSRFQGRA